MNKIIYTFLLLTFFLFAKAPGIPGTEIEIYRIVLPKGKSLDPKIPIPDLYLKHLGESKQSITTALSDLQVSVEADQWTGKEMIDYPKGPVFWFWFNDVKQFDSFGLSVSGKDFLVSKKYQIRPGFEMPQALLNEIEHRTYVNSDGTVTFSFFVSTPYGDFATNLLYITMKDNKIQWIRYGYSE